MQDSQAAFARELIEAGWAEERTSEAAAYAMEEAERRAADGDLSLVRLDERNRREGWLHWWKKQLKQDRQTVVFSSLHRTAAIPARQARPVRGNNGATVAGQQLSFLLDFTRDDLRRFIAHTAAQVERLNDNGRTARHLLRLLDEYPDATTGREACERAGIDPATLVVEG